VLDLINSVDEFILYDAMQYPNGTGEAETELSRRV